MWIGAINSIIFSSDFFSRDHLCFQKLLSGVELFERLRNAYVWVLSVFECHVSLYMSLERPKDYPLKQSLEQVGKSYLFQKSCKCGSLTSWHLTFNLDRGRTLWMGGTRLGNGSHWVSFYVHWDKHLREGQTVGTTNHKALLELNGLMHQNTNSPSSWDEENERSLCVLTFSIMSCRSISRCHCAFKNATQN